MDSPGSEGSGPLSVQQLGSGPEQLRTLVQPTHIELCTLHRVKGHSIYGLVTPYIVSVR